MLKLDVAPLQRDIARYTILSFPRMCIDRSDRKVIIVTFGKL